MRIIRELEQDSRLSNIEVASRIGVSEGTVRKRLQKLIQQGIIKRFTLELSTKAGFTAFTLVRTDPNEPTERIVPKLSKITGVKRVFDLAGKIDYLVEIVAESPHEFNEVIEKIRRMQGVDSTESLVVLNITPGVS